MSHAGALWPASRLSGATGTTPYPELFRLDRSAVVDRHPGIQYTRRGFPRGMKSEPKEYGA